jgi:hypothetical protein
LPLKNSIRISGIIETEMGLTNVCHAYDLR